MVRGEAIEVPDQSCLKKARFVVLVPFIFGHCATYRHCDGEQGIEDDRKVGLGQARVITRFS